MPHNAAFDITGTISTELWIKTSSTSEQYILTKGDDNIYMATSAVTAGKFHVYLAGISSDWTVSNANVCDGAWHHVAFTRNGTTIKLYIDGVVVECI